jgi:hypothetical protein
MVSKFLKSGQSLDELGAREVWSLWDCVAVISCIDARFLQWSKRECARRKVGLRIAPRIRVCRSGRWPRVRIAIRESRFEALQAMGNE